jgi:hypothetical protein
MGHAYDGSLEKMTIRSTGGYCRFGMGERHNMRIKDLSPRWHVIPSFAAYGNLDNSVEILASVHFTSLLALVTSLCSISAKATSLHFRAEIFLGKYDEGERPTGDPNPRLFMKRAQNIGTRDEAQKRSILGRIGCREPSMLVRERMVDAR